MKNFLFVFYCSLSIYSYSQGSVSCDIIYLYNGREISAKIDEIGTDIIKYHNCENDSIKFTNSLMKSDIFMIKYSNGTKDIFSITDIESENQGSETKFGNFIDPRDSTKYKTVQIGYQIWFAENLKYDFPKKTKFNKYVKTDDDSLKNEYYYTGWAATRACPDGWRLPSMEDFRTLCINYNDDIHVYHNLKVDGGSGFDGLLAGYYNPNTSILDPFAYKKIGENGYWWTSTEDNIRSAESIYFTLSSYYQDAKFSRTNEQYFYFSVRCIKSE